MTHALCQQSSARWRNDFDFLADSLFLIFLSSPFQITINSINQVGSAFFVTFVCQRYLHVKRQWYFNLRQPRKIFVYQWENNNVKTLECFLSRMLPVIIQQSTEDKTVCVCWNVHSVMLLVDWRNSRFLFRLFSPFHIKPEYELLIPADDCTHQQPTSSCLLHRNFIPFDDALRKHPIWLKDDNNNPLQACNKNAIRKLRGVKQGGRNVSRDAFNSIRGVI